MKWSKFGFKDSPYFSGAEKASFHHLRKCFKMLEIVRYSFFPLIRKRVHSYANFSADGENWLNRNKLVSLVNQIF